MTKSYVTLDMVQVVHSQHLSDVRPCKMREFWLCFFYLSNKRAQIGIVILSRLIFLVWFLLYYQLHLIPYQFHHCDCFVCWIVIIFSFYFFSICVLNRSHSHLHRYSIDQSSNWLSPILFCLSKWRTVRESDKSSRLIEFLSRLFYLSNLPLLD